MRETTEQLAAWQGEFGNAYTDRNVVDWRVRLPALRSALEGLAIHRVLEVGCNRGHNLRALSEVLGDDAEVFGVEPNEHALAAAISAYDKVHAIAGSVFQLPFADAYFDLALTIGVLIHISPEDLPRAMQEIARVSQRYILAAEYYAETDTPVQYRGLGDLLWKRDFQKHYQSTIPGLTLIRSGYWDVKDGFDRTHWWLFEKEAAAL